MMKIKRIFTFAAMAIAAASCINLDLAPLDKPATGNWYKDKEQVIMSLTHHPISAVLAFRPHGSRNDRRP